MGLRWLSGSRLKFYLVFFALVVPAFWYMYIQNTVLASNNQEYIAKIEQLQDNYENIQSQLKNQQNAYVLLEEKITSLKADNETACQRLNDANNVIAEFASRGTTIEGLDKQIAELLSEKSQYELQIKALENQKNIIEDSNVGALTANTSSGEEPDTNNEGEGVIVYWVPNGKVYHSTPNCSTLKRSSNIISGSISQSGKGRGCKVCY